MYAATNQNVGISGSVERVTFHNPENGYCVLQINSEAYHDLITVTANLPRVTPGEQVECSGEWFKHEKFGWQFKADKASIKRPTSVEAIVKYLSSGVIRGIGESSARKLAATFGENTLAVIEDAFKQGLNSVQMSVIKKIINMNGKNWKKIEQGLSNYLEFHRQYEQERLWLTELGVGPMSIQKLIKEYAEKTIAVIENNPYILIEKIKGFGFVKSDDLALRLGIPADSPFRVKAGLVHLVKENNVEGSCYISVETLLNAAAELLGVGENICFEQLQELVTDDDLRHLKIGGISVVGLTKFDEYEKIIADKMKRLCSTELAVLSTVSINTVIEKFEVKTQWTLNAQQRKAIIAALTQRCLIVTGGPGTGKTTITRCISMALADIANYKLIGCSPTGRAAKRLSESLNAENGPKIECSSIHRLLEARVSENGKSYFNRTANNPIEVNTLIVDEMSMVDVSLFYHLLQALPLHAQLIMIGDVDQLSSVGPGRVLSDLIESGIIPVVRLTKIQRQAAASKIISNAHRINSGVMPILEREENESQDFYFIEEEEPEIIKEKLLKLVCKVIPERFKNGDGRPYNPLLEVQVLSPMKNSVIGVNALNASLQQGLNPNGVKSENKLKRGEYWFCEGDKVIQTVNNYDKGVFNGDIGFIQKIDKEEGVVEVLFFSNDLVTAFYKIAELEQLSLAYATTIHKSQGSEYPIVVIPISTQHYIMLKRNLVYTGVTRGKKLVFMIGQKNALQIAVENNKISRRITNLKERLIA